jgi:hypothetical protein
MMITDSGVTGRPYDRRELHWSSAQLKQPGTSWANGGTVPLSASPGIDTNADTKLYPSGTLTQPVLLFN